MLHLVNNVMWLLLMLLSFLSGAAVSQSSGDIRLVGGTNSREGRVEIYYNGEWGTVCDDNWGIADANVVCRQLGLDSAVDATSFGEGTGQIWVDNVDCIGYESRLSRCSHNVWGRHNCDHSEDAGVRCDSAYETVRLVGGSSTSEGRLEIYYNDDWRTVCDDSFTLAEGNVICRQLGYSAATSYSNDYYGEGYGPIMSHISCVGYESNWEACTPSDRYTFGCSHSDDVVLQCTSDQFASTSAVTGIVVVVIIFVLLCICCGSVCVVVKKNSGSRQQRSGTAPGAYPMTTSQPPIPAPAVTNQTTGDDPTSYKDVIASPVMYPQQGGQTNPAYPPQSYPQQPYPTQQGIIYPPQSAIAPYPTQTAVAPYPQQSTVVPYPPQPVLVTNHPYPGAQAQVYSPQGPEAPVYPPPGTQSEMYPQQGNPQSERSAPPIHSGDRQHQHETVITPNEAVQGTTN